MTTETVKARRSAPLKTPNPLSDKKVRELSGALNLLLADAFALYLKTKNFHWHVSGPHFRDYHLLLDEQADQIAVQPRVPAPIRSAPGSRHRSA
jgi:starvation-inducible DNA-binding protein